MTLPNGTPATTSYVKSDSSGNLSYTDVNFILPAGMMMMYGGTSTPAGWLFCVGQVVSQTTYANLYSAIGSAFNTGGEGAGNFRLPDFRRKAPVGAGGTGSATLGNSVGNSGGAESVTLTTANLPSAATTTSAGSHIHSILTGWTGAGGGTRNFIANGVISNQPDAVYTSSYSGADLTQSAGTHTHTISGATDTSVNNIQPSLVVNYIIKY
jgi:microcystin-dependent protein